MSHAVTPLLRNPTGGHPDRVCTGVAKIVQQTHSITAVRADRESYRRILDASPSRVDSLCRHDTDQHSDNSRNELSPPHKGHATQSTLPGHHLSYNPLYGLEGPRKRGLVPWARPPCVFGAETVPSDELGPF